MGIANSLTPRIQALTAEIAADEEALARKRMKLEVLAELAGDLADLTTKTKSGTEESGNGKTRPYAGQNPTEAIWNYLKDHPGNVSVKTLLSELAPQIDTVSSKPRSIVRACLKQLAKRDSRVRIAGGNVALKL